MANIIVNKKGFYWCDGKHKCEDNKFLSKKHTKTQFHCEQCPSFQQSGLTIFNSGAIVNQLFDSI